MERALAKQSESITRSDLCRIFREWRRSNREFKGNFSRQTPSINLAASLE